MSAKVLLIGLDAADRDLLLNYAQTGVMPVLGGLLEQGLRGETKMPPGSVSKPCGPRSAPA